VFGVLPQASNPGLFTPRLGQHDPFAPIPKLTDPLTAPFDTDVAVARSLPPCAEHFAVTTPD